MTTALADTPDTESPPAHRKRDDDDDVLALWYAHSSPEFAGILTGDGWKLDATDPTRIAYVSATGTRLSQDQIRALAIHFTTAVELDLESNAADLVADRIDLDEWHRRAKQTVDDEIYLLAALGAGGVDELTDEDRATINGGVTTAKQIGTGIKDATARLGEFADEMASEVPKGAPDDAMGAAGSEKQVVSRAGQYARPAYGIWQATSRAAAQRLAQKLGLKLEERNILDDGAKHCRTTEFTIGCPECTEQGWMPIGSLPDIGLRSCSGACRCSWRWRVAPEAV